MCERFASLYGDIDWPDNLFYLVTVLQNAGFVVSTGRYSITIHDCEGFHFRECGGDLGDPVIEASADTVQRMIEDARRVSAALHAGGLGHDFEVFDEQDELVLHLFNGRELDI